MDELKSFMYRFCSAGAAAVGTYIKVSAMPADTMPEYFLSSLIFRDIGLTQAVTLETPWWQIHEWVRKQSSEGIGQEGSWKVDMVIYDGGGKRPEDQNIWAMVEVKNGYIDADFMEFRRTDRGKLIRLSMKFKESTALT